MLSNVAEWEEQSAKLRLAKEQRDKLAAEQVGAGLTTPAVKAPAGKRTAGPAGEENAKRTRSAAPGPSSSDPAASQFLFSDDEVLKVCKTKKHALVQLATDLGVKSAGLGPCELAAFVGRVRGTAAEKAYDNNLDVWVIRDFIPSNFVAPASPSPGEASA